MHRAHELQVSDWAKAQGQIPQRPRPRFYVVEPSWWSMGLLRDIHQWWNDAISGFPISTCSEESTR